MPTYLYCVLPATAEAPPVLPAGVGGAPTRVLRAHDLAAWVGTVAARNVEPTIERVKAHDEVTDAALLTGATPLPARFGQTFESDDACLAALRHQAMRLLADLEEVRDLVEMRVVLALVVPVTEAGDGGTDSSPGRAYMQRLMTARGREQSIQALATGLQEEVHAAVAPYVRRRTFSVSVSPAILRLSHLVARGDLEAYRTALRGTTFSTPVGQLVVSGPGAPYQFVSAPA